MQFAYTASFFPSFPPALCYVARGYYIIYVYLKFSAVQRIYSLGYHVSSADSSSINENSFIVGLMTYMPSSSWSVSNAQYTLCNIEPASNTAGRTAFIGCLPNLQPAQFVLIESSTASLVLCDVQIFAKGKTINISGSDCRNE